MSTTPAVQALLDLENSESELLFEQVPGSAARLWPLVRWPLASALASAQLDATTYSPPEQFSGKLFYLKRMAREALPNPRSADRLHQQFDHLFLVSGGTLSDAPRGIGNWLSDELALALGSQAAVVQDERFDLLTPGSKRPANPRTWTWDPAHARVRDAAKAVPLSADHQTQVVRFMEKIYPRLQGLLPAQRYDAVTQEALGWVRRLKHVDAEFTSLLERVRPRRIYMQQASYSHLSSLVRLAHERGIEVAELQHGWIGASHAAYNYGEAWFDSPLTSSLPDTLVTFGDFWSKDLRFPGKIVPVGKPSLDKASNSTLPYHERRHRLLVVSSDYEHEKLNFAATLLRRLLPSTWEVVLRPHPHERPYADTLFAASLEQGVSIDEYLDVNLSIGASRAVVGMVSTVLFEALVFGVHIGVLETPLAEFYANADAFPQRLTGEDSFIDFAKNITSDLTPMAEHVAAIWHPRPVESFLKEFASA